MIASTASHFTLEEIAEAGGEGAALVPALLAQRPPSCVESFVGRAEAAGYGAIVVTVDTFIPGWKPRDLQQAWLPVPRRACGNANYFQDPVFRAGLEKPPEEDIGAATGHYLGVSSNPSLTWDDLDWLRELTSLPILVKGIQHVDDAREAARARRRRDRRLQPRRPPGRRRARLARRAAADRRGGRRRARRSSSTAASAAAPTSSRRSPSAPTPSASAAPTSGAWRSTARPGSKRC